jgi:hypothetical protein
VLGVVGAEEPLGFMAVMDLTGESDIVHGRSTASREGYNVMEFQP